MAIQVDELILDGVTADPTPAIAGLIWYRSDLGQLRWYPASLVAEDIDTNGGTAASVPFTPNGDIAATDVQSAIQEVRDDTDTKLADKVTGPGGVTDNRIARFDGTTGKLIQDSQASLSDAGDLFTATLGAGAIEISGTGLRSVDAHSVDGNDAIFKMISTGGSEAQWVLGNDGDTGDFRIARGFFGDPLAFGTELALDGTTLDVYTKTIVNVVDPVNPQDAATKAYVDSAVGGGSGDVVGPASATDDALARYDGTSGTLIQDSNATLDDSGNLVIQVGSISVGAPVDPNCVGLFADDAGKDFCVRQISVGSSAFLRLEKGNGTLAAPTAVLSGEKIGGLSGAPHDGTSFNDTAQIAFYATEDQTPTDMGSEIRFETTPDNTALAVTRATLEQDGSWDFAANILGNVADPILDQDAATKAYVDSRPQKYRHHFTGRFYCYTNNRWVTPCDDNYGFGYYQWNESGGTGTDPIDEWEHQGIIVPPGTRLTRLHMRVRANNTEVTDFEYVLYKTMPSTAGRWEGIGVDNDAEVVSTEIARDNFFSPTGGGTAFTGNMADRHHRTVDLSGAAAEFPDLGEWRLYIKPTGTLTATRYLQTSIMMESEDL